MQACSPNVIFPIRLIIRLRFNNDHIVLSATVVYNFLFTKCLPVYMSVCLSAVRTFNRRRGRRRRRRRGRRRRRKEKEDNKKKTLILKKSNQQPLFLVSSINNKR